MSKRMKNFMHGNFKEFQLFAANRSKFKIAKITTREVYNEWIPIPEKQNFRIFFVHDSFVV